MGQPNYTNVEVIDDDDDKGNKDITNRVLDDTAECEAPVPLLLAPGLTLTMFLKETTTVHFCKENYKSNRSGAIVKLEFKPGGQSQTGFTGYNF